MRMRAKGIIVAAAVWFLCCPRAAEALVCISEILADPPAGLAGDANNDGVRDSGDDEFVELFNAGGAAVDISFWSIGDSSRTRHVFAADTILMAGEILAIFGGGAPQLPDIRWVTASSGSLGLNNTNETVTLLDHASEIVDVVNYGAEAGEDQSISRSPEGDGPDWVQHLDLPEAGGQRFSPGFFLLEKAEEEVPDGANTVVPEPGTILQLGLAAVFLFLRPGISPRHRSR